MEDRGHLRQFDTIVEDTCHYTLVKMHSMYNPNVKEGLWIMVMCQWRLIDCNKCITLVWDVDSGGGCWEQGVYGNSLYSVHFCYQPKNALKSKVYFKICMHIIFHSF